MLGRQKRPCQYTHTHDVPAAVLGLLAELCARVDVPGVMLERDDRFPPDAQLNAELDAIAAAVASGTVRRDLAGTGRSVPEGRQHVRLC